MKKHAKGYYTDKGNNYTVEFRNISNGWVVDGYVNNESVYKEGFKTMKSAKGYFYDEKCRMTLGEDYEQQLQEIYNSL